MWELIATSIFSISHSNFVIFSKLILSDAWSLIYVLKATQNKPDWYYKYYHIFLF